MVREQPEQFNVESAGKYSIPVRSVIEVLLDKSIVVAARPVAVIINTLLPIYSI